jgi:heme exporter protein A
MAGEGQSATLTFSGVTCVRGGRVLFSDFDLSLCAGEAALITGPNGVGKSSLLRLAAGLLMPATGTISGEGRRSLANDALALDSHRSLADALGFWAKLDGRTNDHVRAALDAVDLGHLSSVPVRILSTGQRKRASLARVIASGAAVWLLDEPTNGLDAPSQKRLETAVAQHRSQGGIVIAASHQSFSLPGAQHVALGA